MGTTVAWIAPNAAEIDAVENEAQCGRVDFHSGGGQIFQAGKLKRSALEDLVPHGEAAAVPVNDFDAIAVLVFEDEQTAAKRIQMHCLGNDSSQ